MKDMMEIDVRGLPPPEPFEKIMGALQALADDNELLVRIHREPFPLYDVLRSNNYVWHTEILAEDNYQIVISRRP